MSIYLKSQHIDKYQQLIFELKVELLFTLIYQFIFLLLWKLSFFNQLNLLSTDLAGHVAKFLADFVENNNKLKIQIIYMQPDHGIILRVCEWYVIQNYWLVIWHLLFLYLIILIIKIRILFLLLLSSCRIFWTRVDLVRSPLINSHLHIILSPVFRVVS